jgi:microcin C transport system permease protein
MKQHLKRRPTKLPRRTLPTWSNKMLAYIFRRLLLIIPTLFGILLINFIIIQAAPGGPVEQMIAKLEGFDGATSRIAGGGAEVSVAGSNYRGAQGLDPELVAEIERMYGFDKSAPERFWLMLKSYAQLDFGSSFFRDAEVIDLIIEKMPVSISLGLWSTLIMYLVSIPLGIAKATRHGSAFDVWTSSMIIVGYAIPAFLFAILLIVLFAGGSYWDWFPLRGLTSNNFDELSFTGKLLDYFWHLALPVTALVIGNFATLTLLTKNSFLDEINKQYVVTARAKGLSNTLVLYGHVFRNAMLIIIAGFPAAFIGIFFTGSLLIEVIFSLDGLGLISFEAAINRDYPVVFGTLFIFTLLGLVVKLIGDITYTLVDPRIDFESREG